MQKYFDVSFTPSYSCEFNQPIESTWACVKRRILPKFTKLQLRKKCTRAMCVKAVKDELAAIDKQTYLNLLRAHHPHLQELTQ